MSFGVSALYVNSSAVLEVASLSRCDALPLKDRTMGRRKGELTELLEVASRLPWKVSVGLAPVTFIVFRLIAAVSAQRAPVADLSQLGSVVIRGYIHTFAAIFQYLLPVALLIGAAVSFAKRSHSKQLLEGVRSNAANIGSLSWQDFERLVGEGFRHRGFQVSDRGGTAPDGGIDLVLTRGKERFLVQCKQWRAQQVGVSVVRELYGVMAAEQVAGGYVVTSGTFSMDAKKFASGRNIELIDGQGLDALLREAQSAAPETARAKVGVSRMQTPPICPTCRTPMVMRTAKKGSNVGSSFWGCAQYPKCRQTVAMG
jgi:restriction system protein